MYDTGYDFFLDMMKTYGKAMAIEMAKNYLDLPGRADNPVEYTFCCELYEIMRHYETEEK